MDFSNYQLPLNSGNDSLIDQNVEAVKGIKSKDIDNNVYILCINKITGEIQEAPTLPSDMEKLTQNHVIVQLDINNSKHEISEEHFTGFEQGAVDIVKQTLEQLNISKKRKAQTSLSEHPSSKPFQPMPLKEAILSCFGKVKGEELCALMDESGGLTQDFFQMHIIGELERIFCSKEPLELKQLRSIYTLLSLKSEVKEWAKTSSNITNLHNLYECLNVCLLQHKNKIEDLQTVRSFNPQETYLSDVRLLLDTEDNKCWVLKRIPGKSEKDGIEVFEMPKREHVAFLLSEGELFPVPFTVCMNLQGETVSIQKYMPYEEKLMSFHEINSSSSSSSSSSSESNEEIDENEQNIFDPQVQEVEKKEKLYESQIEFFSFQKIVIFDLLFSNLDRHPDNILFQMLPKLILGEESRYAAIAIDHSYCMPSTSKTSLRIETLGFYPTQFPILEQLYTLFSNENINRFAQIMHAQGMPESSICWMKGVGCFLQMIHSDKMRKQAPCMHIAGFLRENYQQIRDTVSTMDDQGIQSYIASLMQTFDHYLSTRQS